MITFKMVRTCTHVHHEYLGKATAFTHAWNVLGKLPHGSLDLPFFMDQSIQ